MKKLSIKKPIALCLGIMSLVGASVVFVSALEAPRQIETSKMQTSNSINASYVAEEDITYFSEAEIDSMYNNALEKFKKLSFNEQKSNTIALVEDSLKDYVEEGDKELISYCESMLKKLKATNNSEEIVKLAEGEMTLLNFLV